MKPIVKYVGGKTWMREHLRRVVGKFSDYSVYGEAFFGGGGSFFSVCDLLQCSTVHLNDISVPVVSMYSDVRDNADELINRYALLEDGFSKFCVEGNPSKEEMGGANEYFNLIKAEFNGIKFAPSIEVSARFMFLQQHSFNGIYRENRKGLYNTPFNWKAKVFDVEEMRKRITSVKEVFDRFDSVVITNKDVFELDCSSGLWYFDPPYIDDGSGMNAYNKDVFNLDRHKELANNVNSCEKFIYSNHPHTELEYIFEGRNKEIIGRRNIMSADSGSRGELRDEVLIYS